MSQFERNATWKNNYIDAMPSRMTVIFMFKAFHITKSTGRNISDISKNQENMKEVSDISLRNIKKPQ